MSKFVYVYEFDGSMKKLRVIWVFVSIVLEGITYY